LPLPGERGLYCKGVGGAKKEQKSERKGGLSLEAIAQKGSGGGVLPDRKSTKKKRKSPLLSRPREGEGG